ncbi:metal-dependent hydrolase [Aeoliella mucimassa]|uniref:Inner membrane protein n=1 Tax=Aeoliella mucimassa TaxID=2527972 RepID=A0A518AJ55_9BACT|nr:metal-dependent hydrolase [Aeoliella mucimassa]QDU54761.1 hypothetical protein Pan181_09440 [Aeoliella mucimassa]
MTTPEHTLVGVHTALATGLHRRFGWQVVVLAAVASNLPDWDGLPMLIDMARFESGHRVWGHNLLAITLSSVLVATLQWRFHLIDRLAHKLRRWKPADFSLAETSDMVRGPAPWSVLLVVCLVAQLLHLPCDMVVSGGKGLSDWQVQPFWPWSDTGYALPLVPWGDVGPTVILMLGVIAVAKLPRRATMVSAATLVVLIAYLLLRGWSRGVVG